MRVPKRRRREGRTDYKARIALLKSRKPRIVVRRTNRYIIVQYVKSDAAQDRVIKGESSKALLKFGWPAELKGSLKSLSAAYLTGFLLGKEIIKTENKECIVDIGLNRSIGGGRIYAALKGVFDAGVKIRCKEEMFPPKERIEGNKKIKNVFGIIKKKIEEI